MRGENYLPSLSDLKTEAQRSVAAVAFSKLSLPDSRTRVLLSPYPTEALPSTDTQPFQSSTSGNGNIGMVFPKFPVLVGSPVLFPLVGTHSVLTSPQTPN